MHTTRPDGGPEKGDSMLPVQSGNTLSTNLALTRSSNSATPGLQSVFHRTDAASEQAYPSSHGVRSVLVSRPLKRRRPDSDVDGPNTASLGSKKRRLRRHLITSRLSQPFSLPATHILNREVVANGDKRFMKLAAIMAARRLTSTVQPYLPQHHPSPSSLLRRAATINRFRLRVRHHASEKGDMDVAQLAADATLLQQSHGIGPVAGARFPIATASSFAGPPAALPRMPMSFKPQLSPHPLSKAAAKGQLPSPGSPPPAAASMPAQTAVTMLPLPPSPKLKPVKSPETRATRRTGDLDEDVDYDVMSFPSSHLDSKYEVSDDHDDVYADFGVIFGGASDDGSDEEGDHYEDYMDDLDGIPWAVR